MEQRVAADQRVENVVCWTLLFGERGSLGDGHAPHVEKADDVSGRSDDVNANVDKVILELLFFVLSWKGALLRLAARHHGVKIAACTCRGDIVTIRT